MMKHGTVTLLLVTLAAAGTAQAAPPQKSVLTFRGLTGQASWFDFAGCVLTSVQVLANENVSHTEATHPVTTDDVAVFYTIFNVCTGDFRNGSGSGTGTINGSLQGVTIQATLPVNDVTVGQLTAVINVTLTPTGDVTRGVNNFHFTGPTQVIQVRSVGATTAAVPSGTVLLEGVDLVAGLSPGTGAISDTNGGTITIFH